MDEATRQALLLLTQKWGRDAAKRFRNAKLEPDPMGRRLIEHGAVCLFNCIMDVRRVLGLVGLPADDPPGDLPLEVLAEHRESP